jgi:hypothetical protein
VLASKDGYCFGHQSVKDVIAVVKDEKMANGVNDMNSKNGYCFGHQSVKDAVALVKDGKTVIGANDMNREDEGDLIMAANACRPEDMAAIV